MKVRIVHIIIGVASTLFFLALALYRVQLGLSARIGMVQRGFEILRTWRTLEIAILTFIIYCPDALSLWLLVKAVGLALGFADTRVLVGMASLSTLVPSGPAFLGTLHFAYMLAIGFAGGPHAVGIAAATLAQLCLLLPVALVAAGILTFGSGRLLISLLKERSSESEAPSGQNHTNDTLRNRTFPRSFQLEDGHQMSDLHPLG